MEACDEMGMMLMVESFDEWKSAKMANGYHKIFDEWVEKDLTNLIRHYRNNPSIVMWCIGNDPTSGMAITDQSFRVCYRISVIVKILPVL